MEEINNIAVVNTAWFAPFEDRPAEEQLEIRIAVERYSLSGEEPPIESAFVKLAFFYIKKEIDAIKKRSTEKIEKIRAAQRKSAENTNRKKRAKKTVATVDRTDRTNAVISRADGTSDEPENLRSDGYKDKDKEIDNIIVDVVDARVDGGKKFLEKYFSERITVESALASLHTDEKTFREKAAETVAEWVAKGEVHPDEKDARRHLFHQIKIKLKSEEKTNERNDYTAFSRSNRVGIDSRLAPAPGCGLID